MKTMKLKFDNLVVAKNQLFSWLLVAIIAKTHKIRVTPETLLKLALDMR